MTGKAAKRDRIFCPVVKAVSLVPSAVPGIKMAVPGINIKRKWLLLVFLLLLFIHSVMSDSFVPLWQ